MKTVYKLINNANDKAQIVGVFDTEFEAYDAWYTYCLENYWYDDNADNFDDARCLQYTIQPVQEETTT